MAFSLACDAGKTTLRIEGTDNNVTWNDVANAGAGSVAVDGGGTEDPSFFVTEHIVNSMYQILKKVQFGDDSNTLIFYSKKETVYFDDGQSFIIKDNATLQLGEVAGDYYINGSHWSWKQNVVVTVIASGSSNAACNIYGSTMLYRGSTAFNSIVFSGGVVDFRNSTLHSSTGDGVIKFSNTLDSLILKDLYISNWEHWQFDKTPDSIENVWMHHSNNALFSYEDVTATDLLITDDATSKIKAAAGASTTIELINPRWTLVQADIVISHATGVVTCKYTCDIHVVDEDGSDLEGVTVACEDKDSNQVFSVQTGTDGKITQQTITHKKWEGTSETETEYSPHKFIFSKNGYTLLVMENVTVDAQINWDIKVKFPERIRARMANPGRLAILR